MRYTVTNYTCLEYLQRRGFNIDPSWQFPDPHRRPSIMEIKEAVAAKFRIPLDEMVSARRSRDIARPRQIAMYLAKHMTAKSLPAIGRHFGDRDHTTVIHAIKQVTKFRAENADIERSISELEAALA